MLAVARRWYRIIALVVVGVTLFVIARRVRGARSTSTPARPAAAPTPASPPAPTPAAAAPVENRPIEHSPIETSPIEQARDDVAEVVATNEPTDTWVTATDGECPVDHPVKAKESSGIYHVEGGLSYARTRADRCYLSPDAAEADGYRAAKR